jgi:hypothetical protein
MGFGRRLLRRSARRALRKTVRTACSRPVRKAVHPVRTIENAVTPRPVKQVTRAAWATRHPVRAAESEIIRAAKPRRRRGFWWSLLKGDTARWAGSAALAAPRKDVTAAPQRKSASAEPNAASAPPRQRRPAQDWELPPIPPEPPWEPEPVDYVPRPRRAVVQPDPWRSALPIRSEEPMSSARHSGQIEYEVRCEIGLGHPRDAPEQGTTDEPA